MIRVYDQGGNMLAVLEYADAVSYQLTHNDLWTATFRLPNRDPKNAFCQMHNLVRLEDGPRELGMYRIIGIPDEDVTGPGGFITYSCEHVAATLLDDLLFGYHEIGGEGMNTAAVMAYILDQQETPRWQLGDCDFTDEFAYKFENDTLLGALMSLGNVLVEPFTWDFDTSTEPWTVSLRRADAEAGCGIYYRRNLQQITKSVDASTLVTRLYLLGYGEGVNQLTIREINGGLPYIDADTVGAYGVKKSVFADRRIEDAEALKARGQALLEGLKIPYTTYAAKAADLAQLTGDAWDTFMPGKIVHVLDGEDGVEFEARIVSVSKSDVRGRSGEVDITIANSPRDIADSINNLADRQGINELYSQGATNLYAQQFADNADARHPAVMRVYVPTGCVRINQMLLSFQLSKFRAYETGAASGGGSEKTSAAGGDTVFTVPQNVDDVWVTSGGPINTAGDAKSDTDAGGTGSTGSNGSHHHSGPLHSHTGGLHSHAIGSGGTTGEGGAVSTGSAGAGNTGDAGSHSHTGPSHSHGMIHYHTITAAITLPEQSITLPSHTHSVRFDDHTHGIEYGIYEGEKAGSVAIKVDGVEIPELSGESGSEIDIAEHLEKDEEGRIRRGAWHTVELVPDGMTRIEANLFVQTFIQSIGGGDY